MRTLERLARGEVIFSEHEDPQRIAILQSLAQKAFCVDAQNVHEWDLLITPEKWGPERYPLIVPPFHEMWFEWTVKGPDGESFNMAALVIDESQKVFVDPVNSMMMDFFMEPFERGIPPVYIGRIRAPWHDDFSWNLLGTSVMYTPEISDPSNASREWQRTMTRASRVIIGAICFFHCKNVTVHELKTSRQQRRNAQRHQEQPQPSFHVIDVHRNMDRTIIKRDGSGGAPVARAATIVRGGFHVYTEDGKLFGKHVGMWKWEPFARGDGPVKMNEYRVHAPSKDHAPRCIVRKPK
jgi:hypothetical protein